MSQVKPTIAFADWDKTDVRLGRMVAVSLPDWSHKLIELKVDFGSEIGIRTIFTGLREWYRPEELEGRCALFLLNLPPKKMGEAMSEGMIMALDGNEGERPVVVLVNEEAPLGSALH